MNAEQLVQDVIDGVESPLVAYAVLKSEIERLNKCLKEIQEYAVEVAEQYGGKFEYNGYKFELRKGGAMYDFSNIPEWNEHKSKLKEIEEKAKAAFKNQNKGLLTADENGEVVPLPVVKYRRDSLIAKPLK